MCLIVFYIIHVCQYLPPKPSVRITSDSSIHYCSNVRKLYMTCGSTLYLLKIGKKSFIIDLKIIVLVI